jgi:membrane protease YdiL (CAAX protease family)
MTVEIRACGRCGHPLSESALFCPNCGAETKSAAHFTLPGDDVVPPPETTVPWRGRDAIPVFLIALGVTAFFIGISAVAIRQKDLLIAVSLVLQEVALFAATIFWVFVVRKGSWKQLGVRVRGGADIAWGVGTAVVGTIVAYAASAAALSLARSVDPHTQAPKQIEFSGHPSHLVLTLFGVGVIVCAPLAEESFFRGLLFRGLRRSWRFVPSMAVAALIFALAHIYPLVMVPIFVLGCILAWLAEKRQSIVPGMIVHALFNTLGFIAYVHSAVIR